MKKTMSSLLVCFLVIMTVAPVVECIDPVLISSPRLPSSLGSMGENWTEAQKLVPSDGATADGFGWTVAVDGDTALICSYRNARTGSVYVYTRVGAIWEQQAKIVPHDVVSGWGFGSSLSLDGDTALIGFPGDGSAYVFIRVGTVWNQQAILRASEGGTPGGFATSVSLSGDTAVIGAYQDDDYGDQSGSAFVFTRTGGIWSQQAKLLAPDGVEMASFGISVAVDGDTALIGAYGDSLAGGSAYVFTRGGTTWNIQAKLADRDEPISNMFGFSVALDGTTAVIGSKCTGSFAPPVWIFTFAEGKWTQQTKIRISTDLGWTESIDGYTAFLGAEITGLEGATYVFTRVGSTWMRQAKLGASDGETWDYFGCSVSVSGDIAVIGARGDDGEKGSAYIFTRQGGNQPPVFGLPTPEDHTYNTPLNLTWIIPIEDREGDVFSCTIQCSNGQYTGAADTSNGTQSLVLFNLSNGKRYKVWVNATDPTGSGLYTRDVYDFVTIENHPPNPPTIQGRSQGRIGVAIKYTFITTDPEDDEISYFIDWGDGTNSSWIGPFASGEQSIASHTWSTKGDYSMKAKAKDSFNYESDWAYLIITMPLSYDKPISQLFERLFQRFPNAFPLLRQLLGY